MISEIIRIGLLLIILCIVGILYDMYKKKQEKDNIKTHYDLVEKYLLNEDKTNKLLQSQHKPFLWIHMNMEKNARHWLSFGSRTSNCLNQPYLLLCIKSIIDKCGNDFNICLINDDSFKKLLSDNEFKVDLSRLADPIKTHMRELAMMKTLHKYGGLIVPSSFICMKNLHPLYLKHASHSSNKPQCFVFELSNDNEYTSQYFPNTQFMGASPLNHSTKEVIEFIEKEISKDFTNEMDFNGQINRKLFELIQENKLSILDGSKIGVVDAENEHIGIERLVNNSPLILSEEACGLYIPYKQLLKRTHYEWITRMSHEQLLESNTNIGKYLLLSQTHSMI